MDGAAPWAAAGGIALVGLSALLGAFDVFTPSMAEVPEYLVVALLQAALLLGLTALCGIAIHAVLSGSERAGGLIGGLLGAAAAPALFAGSERGLGLLAGLGLLVGALGVMVLAVGREHADPVAAVGSLLWWLGGGAATAGLWAITGSGYGTAPFPVLGGLLWLALGIGAIWLRTQGPWDQTSGRLTMAMALPVHLLAVMVGNGGSVVGLLPVGLHLAVVVILFVPAPARAHFGEAPLAALTTARDGIRDRLPTATRTSPRTAGSTDADAPDTGLRATLALVPVWALVAVGLGVTIGLVGLSMYLGESDAVEACTISSAGKWALVEDSPACDAAFNAQGFAKMVMCAGALVALAPLRLLGWLRDRSSDSKEDQK